MLLVVNEPVVGVVVIVLNCVAICQEVAFSGFAQEMFAEVWVIAEVANEEGEAHKGVVKLTGTVQGL